MLMLKFILLELVVIIIAAIFFGPLLIDTAQRRRLPAAPLAASDLENCARLLAFLESRFRGSTIGGLQMDDLAASLRRLLEACGKQ